MQVMRVLDRGTSAIQNILSTVVFAIGPQVPVTRHCSARCWFIAYMHTDERLVALTIGYPAECVSSHVSRSSTSCSRAATSLILW